MGRRYIDNALTTLASSLAVGGTTLVVAAGKGNNFPAIAGKGAAGSALDHFVITMENAAGNREKIRVEERTAGSDTLGSAGYPLVRGYDGTVALAWTAGDSVDLRLERKGVQEELTDPVAAGAPARLFGVKESTTNGLNFGYYGGQMWVDGVLTTIADGVVALTASVTNFIEHDRAGAVSRNAVGFSADKFPMAEVVTNATLITSITDRRIANRPQIGRLVKSVAGGAGTTVLTAAEARNDMFELTGALTGNRTVEIPAIPKLFSVINTTTGAFTLTVKAAAGIGVAVLQGFSSILYTDGVNVRRLPDSIDGMSGGTLIGDVTISKAAPTLTLSDGSGNNYIIQRDGASGFLFVSGLQASFSGYKFRVNSTTDALTIANTGNASFAALLDLSAAGAGQIKFPVAQNASADANTLDDCEKGVWTASVGGTATYTFREGTYTKTGRLVHIAGRMVINVLGTGSTTTISGLPFTVGTDAPIAIADSNFNTAVVSVAGKVNSTSILLLSRTAASAADAVNALFGNASACSFGGCYNV